MSVADKLGFGPKREVKINEDQTYEIRVTPPKFMKLPPKKITLTMEQYQGYLLWLDGMLIQDALPSLTLDQREILMTGIGDEDFHDMFKDDEE